MIDLTESAEEISWNRAALSGLLDLAALLRLGVVMGGFIVAVILIIAATLMGKL
jgi:hypothetical protein